MDEATKLYLANLPPKPINEILDWLGTDEGREWFLNPIVGWDADGNDIRARIECDILNAGKIEAIAINSNKQTT